MVTPLMVLFAWWEVRCSEHALCVQSQKAEAKSLHTAGASSVRHSEVPTVLVSELTVGHYTVTIPKSSLPPKFMGHPPPYYLHNCIGHRDPRL